MGFISRVKQFFASCPLHRLEMERARVADREAEEEEGEQEIRELPILDII